MSLKVTVLGAVNWFEFFSKWLNMIPWVVKDTKSVIVNDLVMLTELPWSLPCLGFSLNQNHLNITSWWYVVGQCLLADLAYRWHDSVKNWPQRWTYSNVTPKNVHSYSNFINVTKLVTQDCSYYILISKVSYFTVFKISTLIEADAQHQPSPYLR